MENNDMNRILGIGPEHALADGLTKTLRIGTVKQLQDVGSLYKNNLIRPKHAIFKGEETAITAWVELLNLIFIEGFTREEFNDSLPEQMEDAVERFLFS
ncbi:hypothetical protein [Paenibacillus radicis (ex Xue et al. 2023)]|uniref:Phage protein n=1 Tax=Paenibacillus radicis (ex Xue et al. 2023) TaxID=2972489 RepID=A0ABT1YM59_9BACL|nr:hypothetical protein [Paenibacillus radicis (ex Xue et al. 2023)]MCR8633494.1 hypothetical protein [Paenibacillus radicis (ex Xue et al. 2023)]